MSGGGISHTQKREVAKGVAKKGGRMSVVVHFDADTFADVRRMAIKNNVSFGEMTRQLVEFGLMDVEENRPT